MLRGLSCRIDRNFGTIVADDGSRPKFQDLLLGSLVAKSLVIAHVRGPYARFRLALTKKRGVAACSGKYLVFLDGDCVPNLDFVAHQLHVVSQFFCERESRLVVGMV
ncbi:MAG: glycosyltransferase [Rhodoferax sp.]|nr:glycosyltransferase [Rhodoferax sp.]